MYIFNCDFFLEFLTHHGISSCAAQARGKKVGQTGGDFHGELSNELFLMSFAGLAHNLSGRDIPSVHQVTGHENGNYSPLCLFRQ